jgi:hypothetical protein
MTAVGTNAKFGDLRFVAALWGEADLTRSRQNPVNDLERSFLLDVLTLFGVRACSRWSLGAGVIPFKYTCPRASVIC